ncbi:MAG: hypothetical protein RML94_15565, partial [Bacteroidia bacterium]|nr:hypothetical protein [Bacteroidia bacterium]
RVGVLRAALSLRCYALLTHPPHASRTQYFNVLPYLYACVCSTSSNIDYQAFTRLKFFTLF